ncbi:MAG: hypothetical protein JOY78_20465 [Pseudonocardia sp.]|nr:hypothetical protein [Pseudonocardia sp.]
MHTLRVSLTELAGRQLALAQAASSGHSAHTICGGGGQALHQTVIALSGGRGLAEHNNPGQATVQVLRGRVRLAANQR